MSAKLHDIERFWDSQGKYAGVTLKVFEHWCLEVSWLQHTLGCAIIFSRHHVERYSQLTPAALIELGAVTGAYERALSAEPSFGPDRFNYLQLGNCLHHLHIHSVPRYSSVREFGGLRWIDPSFGHPPIWSSVEQPRDLIAQIHAKISDALSRTTA